MKLAKDAIMISNEAVEKLMKKPIKELTGPASFVYFTKIKDGLGRTNGSLTNIEMSFKKLGFKAPIKDLPYQK